MTVADHIANHLFNAGVRYVFGIPGGPSIPYLEAFKRAGIEFILVSNEASAGIMADVTARLSGIPGACHATYGPGAANITTGIGGALLDRSPVIVMTSEMSDSMIGRTAQMNINHQKLFEPLVKATFRLNENNASEIIEKALTICSKEYPGPVHIGLPSDIALREINLSQNITLTPETKEQHNDVQKIAALLQDSRRPVLAVGLTAKRLGIGKELVSFLKKYRMPVVITPMAKGIIPEDHACYAGVLFHALSDYLGDIYQNCDLVIGLGYDQVEYNYESWMPDVPLIHFDTRETDLPDRENVVRFTGSPGEWFSLLKNLNEGSLVYRGNIIKGIRDEMISVFDGFSSNFGPVAVLKVLKKELPADSIITADVGSHLHLLGQFWECGSKGDLIITNGWSGMGFGIPAAIAANLHKPESTVVCITGDGGFLMMAGEMVTAKRYKAPVIVVVLSDGELNLIKLKQSWNDIPPDGTILYHGDLFGAESFLGIKVFTADSDDSMVKAVNNALALNEPVIINARIDPDDYKYLIVKQ
ncbi:MAG: thiamine pyrophosphate-binding protein [Bacteroidales bacterium]|nr:thiamine pyrophosphate-binding protein [Bacteroidales bacterium]